MSTDTKYNGWTNYETWLVALWIDNDEGSQDYWREQAADYVRRQEGREVSARTAVAQELENYYRDAAQEFKLPGMFADMLNASLDSVDWEEIADHLLEE